MLAGVVRGKEAVELMCRMLQTNDLDNVSYSMLYFLLRALEKTGLYAEAKSFVETWEECLSLNLLTMPEEPTLRRARSDCHAWSALPLYEYATCYLGVRVEQYGRAVSIQPKAVWVEDCSGKVVTPCGVVCVHFWQDRQGIHVKIEAPSVPVYVRLPDGTDKEFPEGGHIQLSGALLKNDNCLKHEKRIYHEKHPSHHGKCMENQGDGI